MCGFCSYFHFDSSSSQEFPNLDLDTALQYIHHRGPDSRGKYISSDGRCGKLIPKQIFLKLYTDYIYSSRPCSSFYY